MSAKSKVRIPVALASVTVLAAAVIYTGLYIRQARKINRRYGREAVKVSELPGDCARYVDTYGLPLDDPEVGYAWVERYDLDGDGEVELIVDSGCLGRGAANANWAIWKKCPSGEYKCLGTFYCDQFDFVPPWTIYGMPYICCEYDGREEWVPWKNGCYEGKGGIL